MTNYCTKCGRVITRERSIRRHMGDVCYSKMGVEIIPIQQDVYLVGRKEKRSVQQKMDEIFKKLGII